MKHVKEETDSRSEKIKSDYFNIYVFLYLSDVQQIVTSSLRRDAMKANYERKKYESYQQRRQEYIQKNLEQIQLSPSEKLKSLSPSEKKEWVKEFKKEIGNFFDVCEDALSKKVIDVGHTKMS